MIRVPALVAAMISFAAALPATAQIAPPPPPVMARPPVPPMHGMRAFGSMSEAGRQAMMASMQGNHAADRADHDRVRVARDRMLSVLDAERLDTVALRRAMDDERDAANAMKSRRQAALATTFATLSTADRKAFVTDARSLRDRVERRVDKRMHKGMRHRGMHGDMAAPVPPVPPQPPS